jgi:hypothetical protein
MRGQVEVLQLVAVAQAVVEAGAEALGGLGGILGDVAGHLLGRQLPRLVVAGDVADIELLRGKAAAGCRIRIALVDPTSRHLLERDAEERLDGGLVARVRTALHCFQEGLADCGG